MSRRFTACDPPALRLFRAFSVLVLVAPACGARSAIDLAGSADLGFAGVPSTGGTGGSIAATGGSGGSGGSPAACPAGAFSVSGTEPCTPWTDCPPGSYVVVDGTPTSDRQCAPCPVGQTTTEPNSPVCQALAVQDLAVGGNASCVVLTNGTIKCWGDNEAGELGIGNNSNVGDDELPSSVDPVQVASTADVRVAQLSLSLFNACALLSDSSVKCWGSNFDGELGTGTTIGENGPLSLAPSAHIANTAVTATQVGSSLHSCALLSDGSVKCWGANTDGQLGTGNHRAIGDDELPSSIGPISLTTASGVTATQIAVGWRHTCALLSDGSVKCWGDNEFGQLGTGNPEDIGDDELPSSIGPISITTNQRLTVLSLQAASYHTCVLLSDRSVKCWGRNDYGQLGLGNTENIGDDELPSSVGPASISSTRRVSALAIGGHHSCAVLSDGSAKCWGNNEWGQLGLGNTENIGDDELPSSVGPIEITRAPGVTVQKLGLGRVHTCALLSDGTVKCWGENVYGQLGLGNTEYIGDDELPSSIEPVVLF